MTMPGNRYKGFPYPTTDCSNLPSLTVQADKNETDINKIVARISKGLLVPTVDGEPFYGDVSEFDGLQDALIKVQKAESLFMEYPADLRSRFDNDPVRFVDFMSDPANTDAAIALGLAQARPTAQPSNSSAPAPAAPAA